VYDVVVIGAGSAGAVVAARTSENPDLRVLLIEAGPDYPLLAETPFDLRNGYDNSYRDHDWGLRYRPTEFFPERPFPRGRVTGGSSAVNTTIALRGMREDYDAWAESVGCPAWRFERVLPLFCRLERDLDFGDAPYHGDAGSISIRRHPWEELTRSHQAFLETARRLGYPDCPDANDPESAGAGPHPMNKLGRTRVSTAVGYLAPARIRPNLEIRARTTARRLLFRGRSAVALEVEGAGGAVERIEARLFVCAAGAIHTPGLLVRSGIGPPDTLDALGIEAVAELPGVGRNLCDHPAVPVVCVARHPEVASRELPLIQTILRYTAPGSAQRNDLQIELLTFAAAVDGEPCFGVAAVLEQCESRGLLRVVSTDPHAPPAIEPALCSDPRDVERLAGCLLEAHRFAQTKPLAELCARIVFPDPARGLDLAGARELCRRLSGSGYHPCGTARMGEDSDPEAVCDGYGAVRSVENLVVADASLMPSVPRANTNLTCIMIGEQVGEWLRTRHPRYPL
jgi:choline dehydrogenase